MSDRELALELTKIYRNHNKSSCSSHYFESYRNMLESIRKYKSPSTLGEIEELIDEYDKKLTYCESDLHRLIDNIRNLVKGGSNE